MTSFPLTQILARGVVALFILTTTGLACSQPTDIGEILSRVEYFDDRLRELSFECEYDLETDWGLPPAAGANVEGRRHRFAVLRGTQEIEYYHGSFSAAGKDGISTGITTTTLYVDSAKIVEYYRSTKAPAPSIAVYPLQRFRIPRTAPLALMEFPVSDTIKRFKTATARVEKGEIVLDLFYEETRPKPDTIIRLDPRTGYRPKEILKYTEDGRLIIYKTLSKWEEIRKDVYLPMEITCRVDVPADRLLRTEKIEVEGVWFGDTFDPAIFFPDFPSGCAVWDYRFEKGYKMDSSGQIKTAEELFPVK